MPCGGLRAAGLGGGRPLGGGLPPVRGASGVRRCLSRGCPSLGTGSQDPWPVCPGQGWCGNGGPSTGPTARALASRQGALWRWREAVPGGVPRTVVRGSDVRPLPSPGCPSSGWAVDVRYPLAVGAVVRAWGPSTVPLACMPCGGLRAAGVTGGRPFMGGAFNVARGVWCQALSLSRPPVSQCGRPGPVARVSRARVVWAWGTQHRPTACALASRRCTL